MSYNFSLEKILELRLNKEKGVLEEFASVQDKLECEKVTLKQMLDELNSIINHSVQCSTIHDLRRRCAYREVLNDKVRRQEELIAEITAELDKLRSQLEDARKDRKVMEKLKERDYEAYLQNLKILEQKELDEIASNSREVV